ncbi:MAG TPA: hypothetical protein EYP34_08685 [Chromatiaceae bacterium]|nr:hypothetical protein [Chromatiaceae bacterium]
MTRLLLGILIALNAVLFLWIQYGDRSRATPVPPQTTKPDFGQIRLVNEPIAEEKAEVETEMQSDASEAGSPTEKAGSPAPEPASLAAPETEQTGETGTALAIEPEPEPEPQVEAVAVPDIDETSENEAMLAYCGELGPIRSRNMAEGYRRTLSANDAEARIAARPGKETVGYWVMIPEMPDTASAEAMLNRLRKAGFEDLWLMRKGEHKNAISMGLYTQERYAQRYADNIREKGFEPVVVPKQKNARVYWVLFSGVSDEALQKIQSQKLPANAVVEKKVCKQALTGH